MSNKHLFSTLLACFLLLVGSQNIQAQDYPASPLEKEGYRLIFHDEFEGKGEWSISDKISLSSMSPCKDTWFQYFLLK